MSLLRKLTKCAWGEPKVTCHTLHFVWTALPEFILETENMAKFAYPIGNAIEDNF